MNTAPFDVRMLEAFAAVMSGGSITAAARLTGRSQSAVTRLIQELESDVGYTLFTRNGPRIAPTPRGIRFHEEAERVLLSLRQMRARTEAIGQDVPGPMEIAATPALAAGLLPAALARIAGELPREVQVQSLSADQVADAVLERRAEIGLTSLPVSRTGLHTHWAAEAPCVAALPAADPAAQAHVLPLRALAGRRLVTVADPFRLRSRVDQALAEAGIVPAGLLAANTSLHALLMARAGLGIAVLDPATGYGAPVDGVAVRALDVPIPFLWSAVSASNRRLPAAATALLAVLREVAATLPGIRFLDAAPTEGDPA